jgi:putative hydrolase of the HAD superfamily
MILKNRDDIKAIGFDLFNTLITADPGALKEAWRRLNLSLGQGGLALEQESFKKAYQEAALRFINETKADGRETHNRFWISAALTALGHEVPPEDRRISSAVEAYFTTFFDYCRPVPGTVEMLGKLKGLYRLGLLSNFTHPPVIKDLLERMGLGSFFEVVLVSGEIGFRKPFPMVFEMLVKKLGVEKTQLLYVGDDPESDVFGAQRAGLRPVWMTYVQDHNLPVVPGYISVNDDLPGPEIPRVSDWDEFLALLGKS